MKLVLQVWGAQTVVQKVKNCFVVAFFCGADIVLGLIHHQIEIFMKVDFFAVYTDGVFFCVYSKARVVNLLAVHEDFAITEKFSDIFARAKAFVS